jgi:hypothetical protein
MYFFFHTHLITIVDFSIQKPNNGVCFEYVDN